MQHSVTLAQLPYTGFDYGQTYNSLYWVVLLVWSLVIASIIVRNKARFARGFARLAKVFIIEKKVRSVAKQANRQQPEPVILQERVVRVNPRVDSYTLQHKDEDTRHDVVRAVESIVQEVQSTQGDLTQKEGVAKRVQDLVQQELAVSRIGQTPDEFSSEDFATVDFDGVNPDASWQPRESTAVTSTKRMSPPVVKAPQSRALSPSPDTVVISAPTVTPTATPVSSSIKKSYTDTVTLDTESEFPKLVLNRKDDTNY